MMEIDAYSYYILDEQGNPQIEPDHLRWAIWYETADRQLAETYPREDIRVSTVFLSLPAPAKTPSGTALYETMIFAEKSILARLLELSESDDRSIISKIFGGVDIQKRYETKEAALKGHARFCIFIDTCLSNGLV